jgi:Rrf2 family protein
MLSFTRKTDYALVALARLAEQADARDGGRDESVLSARQIGTQYGIPLPVLMNILKELVKGGLVRSTRGVQGGYTLATSPQDITVARVIESIEGPVKFLPCCEEDEAVACRECRIHPRCPITDSVRTLNGYLNEYLNQITLADLVAGKIQTPGRGLS